MALGESLGVESDLIPRMATGFGGGMGGSHQFTCGALTGGLIAAGLAFGRDSAHEERGKIYGLIQDLLNDFRQEFGSVECYQLVGIPYEEPRWSEKWEALKMRERCVDFVRFVVGRWLELAGR